MSKVYLKKIINNSDLPIFDFITIYDNWQVSCKPLIWNIIKSHLQTRRIIKYLCYCSNPLLFEKYLGKEESLHTYDLFTDPLHWESCLPRSGSVFPTELIKLDELHEQNLIVIIDGLDFALRYSPETELLRNINKLKQSDRVLQVIISCGSDLISECVNVALIRLSSVTITLKYSSLLKCDILVKKKSGAIVKSTEEFTLNSKFEIESAKGIKAKKDEDTSNEKELQLETTFNLSLTEDEILARKTVVLPYTRIQLTGARIHYTPDKEDDWDDEDPDDDLEI